MFSPPCHNFVVSAITFGGFKLRSSNLTHALLIQQGNQRWQIPRPATCQCLATFTLLKSKILIFLRDVISLLARVFILLIDTATQEVPLKNI